VHQIILESIREDCIPILNNFHRRIMQSYHCICK